ncbi:hypothetical protein F5877DRAFT_86375 [Lentinula edodes]|nr:hypothetical protein F5877DRAFT_86375 [Lentinula edodes]
MGATSRTKTRATSPERSLRSRSKSSDQSAKSQVFGSPPPTPSRVYGRKSKARSCMNTPSRLRSPPAASTSNTPSRYRSAFVSPPTRTYATQNLALDYEIPIVLPETPPSSASLLDLISNASPSSSTFTSTSSSSKVKEFMLEMDTDADSDTETEFISRGLPVKLSSSREVELKNDLREVELKNELRQARVDLDNALQGAATLRAAEDTRNRCPYCLEFLFQPFVLCCGHTSCKDCLVRLADMYLKAKMNFACPDCRTVQGCFTPVPNYFVQNIVDNMLQSRGIPSPTRQPLKWPLEFQSGPTPLPFPPSAATFPA